MRDIQKENLEFFNKTKNHLTDENSEKNSHYEINLVISKKRCI